MDAPSTKTECQTFQVDEASVRGTVEDTLDSPPEAEADELAGARRYVRSEASRPIYSGAHDRGLFTSAGQVTLKVPCLRGVHFETASIERYRPREPSVEGAMITIGVEQDGYRDVLGIAEDKARWTDLLRRLEQPGPLLPDFFPDTQWQRCVVHFHRNMLMAIHTQEAPPQAGQKLGVMKLEKAAEPSLREISRRTRVVGAFSGDELALMLVSVRRRHLAGFKWGSKPTCRGASWTGRRSSRRLSRRFEPAPRDLAAAPNPSARIPRTKVRELLDTT